MYEDVEAAVHQFVKVVEIIEPEEILVAKYEECYQKFKQIYPALKPIFKAL